MKDDKPSETMTVGAIRGKKELRDQQSPVCRRDAADFDRAHPFRRDAVGERGPQKGAAFKSRPE